MGKRTWSRTVLAVMAAVAILATGCGGSSEATSNASSASSASAERDSEAVADDSLAPEPSATPVPEPSPTPEPTVTPEPTTTPVPTPTPNPDVDGDGVLNEEDDFPDDPSRSAALVSQFPVVDGVSQLDESLPSVQAMRQIQAVVLADETNEDALRAVLAPGGVPVAAAVDVLDQVRVQSGGVWEVIDVRAVTEWWLWIQMGDPVVTSRGTHLLRIGVNPNTGLIDVISVNPWSAGLTAQQYATDRAKTLDEVVADLATKTEFVGVLVADVTADGCTTLAGHNEDVPLNTASVYKQWSLGAAAAEIEAGRLDPAQIVSFVPGEFMVSGSRATGQFESTFELTLQQAANLMMNLSDNGATDVVERTVGRAAAWDFVEASGHSDPDILNPILGIRDYNNLFSSVTPSQVDRYVTGTEEEQQAFLNNVLDPLAPNGLGTNANQNVREYSWRSSPNDICETMATLAFDFAPDSAAGQFIDEAYSGEAFLFGVRNEWDRVWYKGGGIPGTQPETNVVLTHANLVQSNDGRAHAVIVMFNADQGFSNNPLGFEAASLMSRIHELLVTDLAG